MCDVVLLLLHFPTGNAANHRTRVFIPTTCSVLSLQLVPFYSFLRSSDQCKMVRLHAWWSSSLLENRRRHCRIAKCITLENKRQSFVLHGQIKAHCWLLGVRAAIILCGWVEKKRAQKFLSLASFGAALYCCATARREIEVSRELSEDIWIHERVSINARLWPHPPVYSTQCIHKTIILLLYILCSR